MSEQMNKLALSLLKLVFIVVIFFLVPYIYLVSWDVVATHFNWLHFSYFEIMALLIVKGMLFGRIATNTHNTLELLQKDNSEDEKWLYYVKKETIYVLSLFIMYGLLLVIL